MPTSQSRGRGRVERLRAGVDLEDAFAVAGASRATTVRQMPAQAIEAPIGDGRRRRWRQAIAIRRTSFRWPTPITEPMSLTMPVNIAQAARR